MSHKGVMPIYTLKEVYFEYEVLSGGMAVSKGTQNQMLTSSP